MGFRVLLINAPPFEVVEPWYDRPTFGRHGLACIAGHLRDQVSVDLKVIDAKLERIDFAEVVVRAKAFAPDLIGFTAFTNEIAAAGHLAALIKKELPSATTLIGGVHITTLPERTLREFSGFDLGCIGEGENTLVELVQALMNKEDISEVPGLVFRAGDGEILRSPHRASAVDLDDFSPPAWDLFPKAREYWVMTQRGCPFACRFCVNPHGRLPRQRSIPEVVAEMDDILDKYRPQKLWIADEIFTVDMERTHRLLDAMVEHRIQDRVEWWAETHVHFVNEEMFRAMRRAGCTECGLGIESGDEATLRALGKLRDPLIYETLSRQCFTG